MGTLLLLAALAWCYLAGSVCAGEGGLMPMRGVAPGDRLPVNRVAVHTPGHWADEGFPANPRKTEAKKPAYVEWRDTCVRKPRMVAGQALAVDGPGGFRLAPRYTGREDDGTDFYQLLIKELSGG